MHGELRDNRRKAIKKQKKTKTEQRPCFKWALKLTLTKLLNQSHLAGRQLVVASQPYRQRARMIERPRL